MHSRKTEIGGTVWLASMTKEKQEYLCWLDWLQILDMTCGKRMLPSCVARQTEESREMVGRTSKTPLKSSPPFTHVSAPHCRRRPCPGRECKVDLYAMGVRSAR